MINKFKIGEYYLCVKDFYTYEGELVFKNGNTYPVIYINNEQGVKFMNECKYEHWMKETEHLVIFDIIRQEIRKEKIKRIL